MVETKHLTIMLTDIKGFTPRTSESSRTQLHKMLELHDKLISPLFEEFGGTIVKTIGDAFLVTFNSPTDAVLCGIKIQKELGKYNEKAPDHEKLDVRIAINSGEVALRKKDVFGEPVNIVARLESIAEPGDIYFTEAVYLAMNKAEIPTAEVGHRYFKGIPEEIKVYKVLGEKVNKKRGGILWKEKPYVRAKRVHREKMMRIFSWIGIIVVSLIVLNTLGLPFVLLVLLAWWIGRMIWRKFKGS